MPPSAAPECERVGWSFEIIATSAPASWASMAARMPAHPAPTTSTSCSPITESSGYRPGRSQLRGKLLEVLAEHPGELARLAVVRLRVAPRRARVEELRVDARHLDGHPEAEDRVGAVLDVVELPCERRVQQGARRRDRHALALAERAARPPGVHEPDGRAVLVELVAEHLRVHGRRLRQERRREARRERRLRLGDPDLRAGELRREAGEEV